MQARHYRPCLSSLNRRQHPKDRLVDQAIPASGGDCSLFETAAYDYELPQESIAQEPPARRDGARLLVVDKEMTSKKPFTDLSIQTLPELLDPGDLLVANDTRVVPARLRGHRISTGGAAEVLLLDLRAARLSCLLKTRGHPQVGERFSLAEGEVILKLLHAKGSGLFEVSSKPTGPELEACLESAGEVPLPPYIRRRPEGDPRAVLDRERYQTLFAREAGAVAAPTAGLHFTHELLAAIKARGAGFETVTLHVGLGTFQPVRCRDLRQHPMHLERYHVSPKTVRAVSRCRARGGRVVALGTTTARVLESALDPRDQLLPGSGWTRLFIYPPYRFRLVNALITNFHAPRSTLLMLVAALAGRERIISAYKHALEHRYRFLSYGDAMFIAGSSKKAP